jgi:hypothetical protein
MGVKHLNILRQLVQLRTVSFTKGLGPYSIHDLGPLPVVKCQFEAVWIDRDTTRQVILQLLDKLPHEPMVVCCRVGLHKTLHPRQSADALRDDALAGTIGAVLVLGHRLLEVEHRLPGL